MKVNSRVMIYLRRRSEVELVSWDITVTLVPDIECGPGQNVVMNLLRRATILEDERDRLLAVGGRGRMRQTRCGLVGNKRPWLPLFIGLCIVSLGCVVRRGRRIVIADSVWVCKEIRAYPSRYTVGNSHSVRRQVWSSIARGAGIGGASAEIAGTASLQAAACPERPVAGIPGRACESIGNRSAGTSVKSLSGVAREAAARCGPLGASRKRNPNSNQRNRGETLHEDILRLFAHCGWRFSRQLAIVAACYRG